MATRQYIGARYVPKFYENSDGTTEWRPGVAFESLTIVTYNGNSFTSKKTVPPEIGIPSDNPDYWASTGMYNAQVEALRQEVEEYKEKVDELESGDVKVLYPPMLLMDGIDTNGNDVFDTIDATNGVKNLDFAEGLKYWSSRENCNGTASRFFQKSNIGFFTSQK